MIILFINCVAEYSNVQISGYYSMIRKFWKQSNFLFSNYFDHSPTFWSIHSPKLFDLDLNITSTFFIASHLFLLSINASTPFWMFQRVVRWTWPCTLVWAQPVWSSGLWSSWWRGCSRNAKAGTTRSTPWLAAVSPVELRFWFCDFATYLISSLEKLRFAMTNAKIWKGERFWNVASHQAYSISHAALWVNWGLCPEGENIATVDIRQGRRKLG